MPSFDCELSLAILKVDLDYDSKATLFLFYGLRIRRRCFLTKWKKNKIRFLHKFYYFFPSDFAQNV